MAESQPPIISVTMANPTNTSHSRNRLRRPRRARNTAKAASGNATPNGPLVSAAAADKAKPASIHRGRVALVDRQVKSGCRQYNQPGEHEIHAGVMTEEQRIGGGRGDRDRKQCLTTIATKCQGRAIYRSMVEGDRQHHAEEKDAGFGRTMKPRKTSHEQEIERRLVEVGFPIQLRSKKIPGVDDMPPDGGLPHFVGIP